MAVQPRLGLLSQRGTRPDSFDFSNPCVTGRDLSRIALYAETRHQVPHANARIIRFICMKKYICILASLAVLTACEQKETTVTNPPAEKKESNTTVINPPEQKKETTVINPATETKKEEKTEVNINTSPSP